MLQLEREQDVVVRSFWRWKEQAESVLARYEILSSWLLPIRRRTVRLDPEARLARMITLLQHSTLTGNESALMERLEAAIAATEDVEVRRVLAAYLTEP